MSPNVESRHIAKLEEAAVEQQPADPVWSVVIPVRNSAEFLAKCLSALAQSVFRDFEVTVVDDASTDSTAEVAERFGARVIRLPDRSGPAVARNRGAQESRGAYLLFLDADVCVKPNTLTQFNDRFASNVEVAAVFGSYDTRPPAANLASQYKNLLHCHTHQIADSNACTFWSGCGAVHRSKFQALGGFSSHYARPCVEDIQLGMRLRQAGRRILLDKDIQVTHLKHWTLAELIRTDIVDRAIPWSLLIVQARHLPNDLNLRVGQRISAFLAGGLVLAWLLIACLEPIWFLLPVVLLALLFLTDCYFPVGSTGQRFAALSLLAGLSLVGFHLGLWTVVPALLVAGLVIANWRMLRFLAQVHSLSFAVLAFPLHLLYLIYSSLTFAGCAIYHLISPTEQPPDCVSAREPQIDRQGGS